MSVNTRSKGKNGSKTISRGSELNQGSKSQSQRAPGPPPGKQSKDWIDELNREAESDPEDRQISQSQPAFKKVKGQQPTGAQSIPIAAPSSVVGAVASSSSSAVPSSSPNNNSTSAISSSPSAASFSSAASSSSTLSSNSNQAGADEKGPSKFGLPTNPNAC